MKKHLLLIIAACFTCVAAFAQWTEPEIPTTASTFTAGHLYRVRNADGQLGYLAGGTAWYSWSTSTVLLFDLDVQDPITYSITMDYDEDGNELGYTFVDNSTSLYTFISNETITDQATGEIDPYEGMGEMHMDGASSNYSKHYDITLVSGTTYQISVAAADTIYGETKAGTAWGYMPKAEVYIGAVWPFLDPSNSDYACTWEFIDMTIYQARLNLYNTLVESQNYSDIDQSVVASATEVYNNANATLEELEAATQDVKVARNYAITKDASTSNPVDATTLIENNDFETGNIEGWYCSFVSEVNATNIGFQSGGSNDYTNYTYTYTNHEGVETNPFCKNFIEAWSAAGLQYGSTDVSRSIGDGELSQTIKEMPKGNWKLSADVIASYQDDASITVTGTELFAVSGDYEMSVAISTGNGVPEHIEMLFASSGDDLTLGLRTNNTNANWICADNFELTCYGDEDSAYKFILEQTISDAEAKYPDMSALIANAEVKAAYETALADAHTVLDSSNDDAELQAAADALTAAVDALGTSISEYVEAKDYMDYILTVQEQAETNDWDELAGSLGDYYDNASNKYEAGTLTGEEIAQMQEDIPEMIADYLGTEGNIKDGDDVSILIRNNDFDTDFSGWTYNTAPNWGGDGNAGGGENTLEGKPTMAEIASGNAEYYWTAFDINQTIKSMPVGLYKLTLQVFERDDAGDGIDAVMYASIGGSEQTELVTDIYRDAQDEMQYSTGAGASVWPDDTYTDGIGYTPNSMAGANVYFYEGLYTTTFNILVTERGDLTIGLRKDNATDWVLFDTFRLVYQGNSADVYADYIDELIAQADEYAAPAISYEVDAMIVAAIDNGEEALDSNSADACIAAIQELQAAIAAAEASAALVIEIEELYDYTNDVRMAEASDVDFSDDYMELLETIASCLDDGFETDAAIEEYMEALNAGFNADVLADAVAKGASESNPVDVTPIIVTASCVDSEGETSYYGWTPNEGTVVGAANYCIEIYEGNGNDAGAGIEQVLYNLSAGYYRLGVQGFYRPGTGFYDYNSTTERAELNIELANPEEGNDTIHYADIYAGETATRMISIIVCAKEYSEGIGVTSSTVYAIPNTMAEAENAFDLDLYHNCLQFEVAENGTDVPVGIVKTGDGVTNDWLIWTNWTLEYLGTTEPVNDPTTAIESVDGSGDVVAKAIYSVNGVRQSRLTKGVNIVKSTLSDGSVEVTKILVK